MDADDEGLVGGMEMDVSEEEEDGEEMDEEEEDQAVEGEEEEELEGEEKEEVVGGKEKKGEEDEEEESVDFEEESVDFNFESEHPLTDKEYREELNWALNNVVRPGSFCVEGTLNSNGLPGLEVARLGPIGLPLTPFQAKELALLRSQAPFGRREATMYDPSVRRCLQLPPDQFRLSGPNWAAQVQGLVNTDVKRGLGVPEHCKVVPQLHKLLLYEAGSFFKPHRDSEKEDGMFGTLVIVLPSAHKGGELVVRHARREEVFSFDSRCLYQIHYAAFYADCEHEILPVKSGHRLVLVYNLIAQGAVKDFKPEDNRPAVRGALVAIRSWSEDEEGPTKLVLPLAHKYSSRSLSFHGLKGMDIATVDILCQAAKVPNKTAFHFYLGMLKKFESNRRENTLQLTGLIAPPGRTAHYHKLECYEDELVPIDALHDRYWDHQQNIHTGNEGMASERWYRHAAMVFWPHSKHWDVACMSNVGKAIKEVSELAQTAKNMQHVLEETLLEGGQLSRGEAALIWELVTEHGDVHILAEIGRALKTICLFVKDLTAPQSQTLTKLLLKFGDVETAKFFLRNFPFSANSSVIPALASHFGWAALGDDIMAVLVRMCDNYYLPKCLELLLKLAPEITGKRGQAGQADFQMRGKAPESGQAASQAGQMQSEAGHGMSKASGTTSGASAKASGEGRPRKLNQNEQERQEVCRRAVSKIVELLSYPPPPGTKSASSHGGKQTFQFSNQSLPPFVRLIERFGKEPFCPAADALIRNKISSSLRSAVEVLWDFVRTGGKWPPGDLKEEEEAAGSHLSSYARELSQRAARELVTSLAEEIDAKPYRYSQETHGRGYRFIVRTLKLLHRLEIEPTTIDSAVAHFLATPVSYPLDSAVVPAVKELSTWLGKEPMNTPWFSKLWTVCMAALQEECEKVPAKPKNWALPAVCECSCQHCQRLLDFCRDPKRTEVHFSLSAKEHLKNSIDRDHIPVCAKDDNKRYDLIFIKEGSRGILDEKELKDLAERGEKHARFLQAMGELILCGEVNKDA